MSLGRTESNPDVLSDGDCPAETGRQGIVSSCRWHGEAVMAQSGCKSRPRGSGCDARGTRLAWGVLDLVTGEPDSLTGVGVGAIKPRGEKLNHERPEPKGLRVR